MSKMYEDKKNRFGIGKGIVEDTTEYGEFIASFDAWLTPEEQKRRAKHLEDLGKEE